MNLLRTAFWASVLATAGAAAVDGGLAPDGKRGFGTGQSLSELLHVFRQPDDEDRRWLAALATLPGEIDTFVILARDRYAARGYFALLEPEAQPELATLHAAFRAAEADAPATLARGGARATAFARMYFDLRFWLRAEALERYPRERVELAAALAVLRAATDGHVQLGEQEARAIAGRADLAASFLRAIRADLESLHVAQAEADVESATLAEADELVALAAAREKDRERAFELAARIDELARRKRRMAESLGVARLATRLVEALSARERAAADAAALRDAARQHFEEPAPGTARPKELAKLSRGDRLRAARELAARCLAKDPLDEEATWILAKTIDHFEGEAFSRPYFDRYLALRGIRAHLWETIRDRALSKREQEALDVVQRATLAPAR